MADDFDLLVAEHPELAELADRVEVDFFNHVMNDPDLYPLRRLLRGEPTNGSPFFFFMDPTIGSAEERAQVAERFASLMLRSKAS